MLKSGRLSPATVPGIFKLKKYKIWTHIKLFFDLHSINKKQGTVLMSYKIQENFWNKWAGPYHNFSKNISPYRDAQRSFALSAVNALGENISRPFLRLLDAGGGAGNMITPILETVLAKRGNLSGVSYTLTDGSAEMLALSNLRLEQLQLLYPDVTFQLIHIDTLNPGFMEKIGQGSTDLVISSWNIEYYSPETKQSILSKLRQSVCGNGIVAFSSIVRLPNDLSIKKVLMPLGTAQVIYTFLTGGIRKMKTVIQNLKDISEFGLDSGNVNFPEKPLLSELETISEKAGLQPVLADYHLYGASGMIVACNGSMPQNNSPKASISKVLMNKKGYEGSYKKITFWNYLYYLLRTPN